MTETFRAIGLHHALYLVPVAMGLTGVFLLIANPPFAFDAQKMAQSYTADGRKVIMMMEKIEAALAVLQPQALQIEDESHMHSRGQESHFKVVLVSAAFDT